jgi:hypothetical protein
MNPAQPVVPVRQVAPSIRAASVLHLALGIGFGVGAAVTADHLRRQGELPMTRFGFRSLSGGPFEQLTPEQFTALAWALVGVCAVDVASAPLLWRGRRAGGVVALATTPVALLMAVGFALPFLLVGVPIRVALVLAGWRSLR